MNQSPDLIFTSLWRERSCKYIIIPSIASLATAAGCWHYIYSILLCEQSICFFKSPFGQKGYTLYIKPALAYYPLDEFLLLIISVFCLHQILLGNFMFLAAHCSPANCELHLMLFWLSTVGFLEAYLAENNHLLWLNKLLNEFINVGTKQAVSLSIMICTAWEHCRLGWLVHHKNQPVSQYLIQSSNLKGTKP